AHRAPPHLALGGDEAGEEVLVLAGGLVLAVERDPDHLVAGADAAVPRAVLGGEEVAAVSGGELLALVEGEGERGVVWLHEHVGDDHLVLELGALALVARILVRPDVVPGPAVEAALLDAGDVLGDQVVPQLV